MLAHGLFDSTTIALFYWALKAQGEKALATQPSGLHFERSDYIALSLGAATIVAGTILFRAALRTRPAHHAAS
jgi:hypothetical protein